MDSPIEFHPDLAGLMREQEAARMATRRAAQAAVDAFGPRASLGAARLHESSLERRAKLRRGDSPAVARIMAYDFSGDFLDPWTAEPGYLLEVDESTGG